MTTDKGLTYKLNLIQIEPFKLADRGDRQLLAGENLPRHSLHVLGGHAVDPFQYFIERELPAEEDLLSSNVAHPSRCRLEAQHDRDFELILGPLKLGLGHSLVPELAELLDA